MDPLSASLEFVVANWQWLTGIVIGFVIAAYFYVKGRKKKSPCYALWSVNIIRDLTDKFRDLKITYSGERFKNLTSTKIAFWNAGSETINSKDIAKANPIAIEVTKGCKIIATRILSTKNSANKITVTPTSDQTQARIRFDYLDKGEGAVIQVLHTGQSSADIDINGNIKGVRKLSRRKIRGAEYISPSLAKYVSPAKQRSILAILLFVAPVALFFMLSYRQEFDIVMTTSWAILSVLLWAMGFDVIRKRIPEGFGEFEQP